MRLLLAAAILGLTAMAASADTGRDLLKICGQSASLCGSDFQSDELVAVLTANHCVPADSGQAQGAIVDWLGKHPKAARLEITKAVTQASRALWPCSAAK